MALVTGCDVGEGRKRQGCGVLSDYRPRPCPLTAASRNRSTAQSSIGSALARISTVRMEGTDRSTTGQGNCAIGR